jgi:MoxR-like ATPase
MGFPNILTDADRSILKTIMRRHPGRDRAEAETGLFIRNATKDALKNLCSVMGIDAEAELQAHARNLRSGDTPQTEAAIAIEAEAAEALIVEEGDAETVADEVDPLEAMARNVLKPVEAFAAPAILASLQENVGRLCEEARRLVSEAAQSAPAASPAAPGSIASAKTGKSTLGNVFGIRSKDWGSLPVSLWSAKTETVDRGYVFNVEVLGPVMTSVERKSGVWLHGPKGSGKTELARQIAAFTGRPFVRISMADDMDKYALIGQRIPGAEGEGFVWRDGVLTAAIRVPGTVILLDEVSAAKPGFLFVLQTSLDVRRLTIEETGEVVPFAEGVTFISADNTDGFGDATGRYSGTGTMNEAFLDRFPRKVAIDTASPAILSRIITSRTGLNSNASDMLANLIKTSEAMAQSGKLSTHLSLRPVLVFAADVRDGLPLQKCLETSVLSALPATEAQAMRQHVLAHLDLHKLAVAANPATVSAPAIAPSTSEIEANLSRAARDFAGR